MTTIKFNLPKEDDDLNPVEPATPGTPAKQHGHHRQISEDSGIASLSMSQAAFEEEIKRADEVKSKWKAQEPGYYVLAIGIVLAGCAGFVNATAALTCGGFVSHVTGTTAKLGMALEGHFDAAEDAEKIYQMFLLVFSFLIGALICGLLVARNEVHLGQSSYGVALMMTSLLLIASIEAAWADVPEDWPAYAGSNWIALYLQSAACGLQNGMCTAHFGAVVRTTHLTGLFTDSGLTLGRVLNIFIRVRCNKRNCGPLDWAEFFVDIKKMLVFTVLFFGYVMGVCIGAACADRLGVEALFLPASITGLGGITYSIWSARRHTVLLRDEAEGQIAQQDMLEAEEIFERAKLQIEDWKCTPDGNAQSLEELDGEVSRALHLLHDMENCLNKKLARRQTFAAKSTSSADLSRSVSTPALAKAAADALEEARASSKQRCETDPSTITPPVAG
eukprot:TRINITY_DN1489_c0_g1_i4.p1 TRINITY_DN1489_c0_g1~~TRINITY_DN1489_c0_g1_i4.p1  ORF type:complete len:447 (+),score=69.26 TRINITY_DN1489_c0_g1_i4:144-1484(+)